VSRPSGKRRTLYVHIGLGDTGTRTLQRALHLRAGPLAAAGIVFPAAGRPHAAHHELAWQCGFAQTRPPASTQTPEQIVDAWYDEISRSKGGVGVVSSEYFSLPGPHDRLMALLDPLFDVRVVVYLHRHDLWLPLVYARAVRTLTAPRWGRGYENFLAFRKNDATGKADAFRPLVDAWAALVGKENVLVRPYEVTQIGDSIAVDLVRTIGGSESAIAAVASANVEPEPLLSWEAIQFMDIVQHTKLPADIKRHLVARCAARDPGTTPGTPLASPGFRSGQVAAHFDDYEYIAQRYLKRRDGLLFREPTPTDGAATWKAPSLFSNMWFADRLCEYLGQGGDDLWQSLRALGAGAGVGDDAGGGSA
jgi:hypothetical protein